MIKTILQFFTAKEPDHRSEFEKFLEDKVIERESDYHYWARQFANRRKPQPMFILGSRYF